MRCLVCIYDFYSNNDTKKSRKSIILLSIWFTWFAVDFRWSLFNTGWHFGIGRMGSRKRNVCNICYNGIRGTFGFSGKLHNFLILGEKPFTNSFFFCSGLHGHHERIKVFHIMCAPTMSVLRQKTTMVPTIRAIHMNRPWLIKILSYRFPGRFNCKR